MEWSGRELLNNAKRGCARAEMDRWMDGRMRLVVDVIYHLHNNLNKRPSAGAHPLHTVYCVTSISGCYLFVSHCVLVAETREIDGQILTSNVDIVAKITLLTILLQQRDHGRLPLFANSIQQFPIVSIEGELGNWLRLDLLTDHPDVTVPLGL